MISKIQLTTVKPSFKKEENPQKKGLKEEKKEFLQDFFESEYQEDLTKYKKTNLWSSIFLGLGFGGYSLLKGNIGGAIVSVAAAALAYPITNLFKPKKIKYDNKLQAELNKLENSK